jgi:hypothetical protein
MRAYCSWPTRYTATGMPQKRCCENRGNFAAYGRPGVVIQRQASSRFASEELIYKRRHPRRSARSAAKKSYLERSRTKL